MTERERRLERRIDALARIIRRGWFPGYCSPGEGDPCGDCHGCAVRAMDAVLAGQHDVVAVEMEPF